MNRCSKHGLLTDLNGYLDKRRGQLRCAECVKKRMRERVRMLRLLRQGISGNTQDTEAPSSKAHVLVEEVHNGTSP